MQDAAPTVRHLAWCVFLALSLTASVLVQAGLTDQPNEPDPADRPAPTSIDAENAPENEVRQDADPPPEPPGEPLAETGDAPEPDEARSDPPEPAADETPTGTEPEPAVLQGVQPGSSSRQDVHAAWGAPLDDEDGEPLDETTAVEHAAVEHFDVPPLGRAEVRYRNDRVESIALALTDVADPEQIAQQLGLDGIRTARIWSPSGESLGLAYPERGVVLGFGHGDESSQIVHVVLETIDVEAFLLRVEENPLGPCGANLDDLSYVIQQDPGNGRAHWLRARIELRLGRPRSAEESARQATDLEPRSGAYRLTWAECLASAGLEQRAEEECHAALEEADDDRLVRAGALLQLARLSQRGKRHLGKLPVDLCVEAIELADSLSADPQIAVRREARRRLVEAHLLVAREIAWGHWQEKSRVVPQWLDKAKRLAEGCEDETDRGDLWLEVAEGSLHALAGYQPTPDPAVWIEMAQRSAEDLIDKWNDPLWKDSIDWRRGLVYFWALQAEHFRGRMEEGLRYGELAREHLERGATSREASDDDEYLASRLYFQIGALHAVHAEDHTRAIEWYERALDSMTESTPTSHFRGLTSSGDALVSMGVSYWKIGAEERAIELTRQGAALIEQDIRQGKGDPSALDVPYGNLAAMHAVRGETAEVRRYEELLGRPPARRQAARTTAGPGGLNRASAHESR